MDLSRVWSLIIVAFRVQAVGRSITEAIERLKPVLILLQCKPLAIPWRWKKANAIYVQNAETAQFLCSRSCSMIVKSQEDDISRVGISTILAIDQLVGVDLRLLASAWGAQRFVLRMQKLFIAPMQHRVFDRLQSAHQHTAQKQSKPLRVGCVEAAVKDH
jgi:hypothetical protein